MNWILCWHVYSSALGNFGFVIFSCKANNSEYRLHPNSVTSFCILNIVRFFEMGSRIHIGGYKMSSYSVPENFVNDCGLFFRRSLEARECMPVKKRSYLPISFSAIFFFFNATRASSRLPTVAAFPFLCLQILSISFAFSRQRLKSASTLWTVAAERFSIIPSSSQHVPTSSHISSKSKSLTTALLAPSMSNVIHRVTNIGFFNIQKVIRTTVVRGREKVGNSVHFKIIGIANSISFNLIRISDRVICRLNHTRIISFSKGVQQFNKFLRLKWYWFQRNRKHLNVNQLHELWACLHTTGNAKNEAQLRTVIK